MLEAVGEREEAWSRHIALGFGAVQAAVYNVNRDTKKHPKPYKATDFVRDRTGERHTWMSPEEGSRYMRQWARARNARIEA